MQFIDYLDEFVADWLCTGRSATTAVTYRHYLGQLSEACRPEVDLEVVKTWLAGVMSAKTARTHTCGARIWRMDSRQRWSLPGVAAKSAVCIHGYHTSTKSHSGRLIDSQGTLNMSNRDPCCRVVGVLQGCVYQSSHSNTLRT